MRIVYHLGMHCTDDERLIKCLLVNRGALSAEKIAVPGPARYRSLLRDTAVSLQGRRASIETQDLLLDEILEDADLPDRLVLSWENFIAFPQWAVREALYPTAGERLLALTRIFPDHGAEFHLAIRNPASFLPELLRRLGNKSYAEMMGGCDPRDLFWSEMIEDIVTRNPNVPVHVWCDEDTPLIWPEVLQIVTGHSDAITLADTDSLLATLFSGHAMKRMNDLMEKTPHMTVARRRRITGSFLTKLALPQRMTAQFDLPGWTADLVEAMTLQYDQDLDRIIALPGVTLTLP